MDTDFGQHYQAAERAYSLGEYTEAHAVASELWDQLQSASDEHDQSIVVGWQAVVSLLLGHIQLHGLQQPGEATLSYQRVLDSAPDATIAALAEQGMERCRAKHTASAVKTTPATDVTIPDLLKDPFLTTATDSDHAKATPPDVVTAMPWLASDEVPRTMPTPIPLHCDSCAGSCPKPRCNAYPENQFRRRGRDGEPGKSTQRRRATPRSRRARTPGSCSHEAFGELMASRSTSA